MCALFDFVVVSRCVVLSARCVDIVLSVCAFVLLCCFVSHVLCLLCCVLLGGVWCLSCFVVLLR